MQKGLIEVFVCSRGGKTHESIFVTDIIPYYLQVSLLMIGLKQADPKKHDQNNETLQGDRVQVFVEWMIDKKKIRFRADDVKSLITTYNDWYTIIDNPMLSGQNDELYTANDKKVPAKGTEVTIIIRAL